MPASQPAIMAATAAKPKSCRAAARDRTNVNADDWNAQVGKGKVTSRCLWNACKALSLGIVLMVLGAAMAILGETIAHTNDWFKKVAVL
jgi:hypothetical protein